MAKLLIKNKGQTLYLGAMYSFGSNKTFTAAYGYSAAAAVAAAIINTPIEVCVREIERKEYIGIVLYKIIIMLLRNFIHKLKF